MGVLLQNILAYMTLACLLTAASLDVRMKSLKSLAFRPVKSESRVMSLPPHLPHGRRSAARADPDLRPRDPPCGVVPPPAPSFAFACVYNHEILWNLDKV